MELALLMDIDGTLTPPRQPLNQTMADALKGLNVPWHVAAGSNLDLVIPQLLQPLYDFGYRKDFDAFVNNGSAHCRCPFSDRFEVEKISEFDFQKHLGDEDFKLLMDTLEGALSSEEFALRAPIKVIGKQIGNRGSMINCTPIGRPEKAELNEDALANRHAFAAFDKETGYRQRVSDFLYDRLERIVREKKLRIMLGGETSFDIVIEGQDKTNAVRTLLAVGYQRLVFFGDALFPGGNDSVITDYITNWNEDAPCPVKAIAVESWEDTIRHFRENGWLA